MTVLCELEAARRAGALEAHGFRRAAIDVLEAALIEQPNAGPLRLLRASMLDRDGRRDEAFADVQQALALVPLEFEHLLILAEGYARAGLESSAADVLLAVAAGRDLPYDLWTRLYAGLWALKQWQAALGVARGAAQQRPDDDQAYYAMAQALTRLGRPIEMIVSVLWRAIDLNPCDARYRMLLAIQLVRQGKHRDAYSCVAELDPAAFRELSCACCAWKLLRLSITFGDALRAAAFAAQLAGITAAATATSKNEESAS